MQIFNNSICTACCVLNIFIESLKIVHYMVVIFPFTTLYGCYCSFYYSIWLLLFLLLLCKVVIVPFTTLYRCFCSFYYFVWLLLFLLLLCMVFISVFATDNKPSRYNWEVRSICFSYIAMVVIFPVVWHVGDFAAVLQNSELLALGQPKVVKHLINQSINILSIHQ